MRIQGIKGRLRLIGLQVPCPIGVHQSVSSVIESENVPASFDIAETRRTRSHFDNLDPVGRIPLLLLLIKATQVRLWLGFERGRLGKQTRRLHRDDFWVDNGSTDVLNLVSHLDIPVDSRLDFSGKQ